MNVFEKLFQTTWNKTHPSRKLNLGAQALAAQIKSIESFASSILTPAFQPQVVASVGRIGIQNQFLFLPTQVSFSADAKLNRKIFLNLALLAIAANNLKLFRSPINSSALSDRIEFLKQIHKCNIYLDAKFDGYQNWQNEIFQAFKVPFLKSKTQRELFEFWQSVYCSRTPAARTFEIQFKTNEIVPEYLFLSVPSLMVPRGSLAGTAGAGNSKRDLQNKNEAKTEIEKPHEDSIENVELNNQEVNPVTHSFEKMETADEYQGGRKMDSGDDELQDHSEALKELNLKKVTRDGEAAKSIYRSDSSSFEFGDSVELEAEREKVFLYPEWSVKKSNYLRDHCKVFEKSGTKDLDHSDFRALLEKKYRHQLRQKKGQIQNLINQPLWVNRLKDGDEIDYDSFARDFAALSCRKDVEGNWYARKLKRTQDFSVLILFDQSLSSDSWVQNQRVLDVILHSIGIAGILFEDVIREVQVAGAWSSTRSKCSFQVYKDFADPWSAYFNRAMKIEPQGYTRLGPSIRHATEILSRSSSKHRLLLILTDGKPTDLDGYEGRYGLEDVKRACQEAERREIVPFALAIDNQAKHYFPKMFSHYRLLPKSDQFSTELYRVLLQLIGKGAV